MPKIRAWVCKAADCCLLLPPDTLLCLLRWWFGCSRIEQVGYDECKPNSLFLASTLPSTSLTGHRRKTGIIYMSAHGCDRESRLVGSSWLPGPSRRHSKSLVLGLTGGGSSTGYLLALFCRARLTEALINFHMTRHQTGSSPDITSGHRICRCHSSGTILLNPWTSLMGVWPTHQCALPFVARAKKCARTTKALGRNSSTISTNFLGTYNAKAAIRVHI